MTAPLLAVNNIEVIYDHVILVLRGVSLAVPEGGIVALLGANGAGKTTTLKAISNLLRAERGDVTKGSIEFARRTDRPALAARRGAARPDPGDGRPPLLRPSHGRGEPADRRLHARSRPRRHRAGPREGLRVFPAAAGAPQEPGRLHLGRRAADDRDRSRHDGAPAHDPAGRALDGPRAAARRGDLRNRRIGSTARRASASCVAEQNSNMALRYADYGYVLENGRIVLDGEADDLRENEDVKEFYLGLGSGGRRSYRDVKHYRRRKRWLA